MVTALVGFLNWGLGWFQAFKCLQFTARSSEHTGEGGVFSQRRGEDWCVGTLRIFRIVPNFAANISKVKLNLNFLQVWHYIWGRFILSFPEVLSGLTFFCIEPFRKRDIMRYCTGHSFQFFLSVLASFISRRNGLTCAHSWIRYSANCMTNSSHSSALALKQSKFPKFPWNLASRPLRLYCFLRFMFSVLRLLGGWIISIWHVQEYFAAN